MTLRPRVVTTLQSGPAVQALLDAADRDFDPREGECWMSFSDYAVHLDAHGILDVTFRATGVGAYPATATSHVTIDVETGKRVTARSAFVPNRLAELRAELDSRVDDAWRRAVRRHPGDLAALARPRIGIDDLGSFMVLEREVVFLVDFALPHVLEGQSPVSEIPMTQGMMRRFIRADGPLRWMLSDTGF